MLAFTVEKDLIGNEGMKQSKLVHSMQVSSRKFSVRTQMPSDSLMGWMAHIGTLKLVNRKSNPNKISLSSKIYVQGNSSYCSI